MKTLRNCQAGTEKRCHSQKNWTQDPFNKLQQRNTQSLFWTFISPVTRWAKRNPDQPISAGCARSSLLEQSPPDSILNRTSPLWLDREALVMWSESGSQDPSEATGANPCEPALSCSEGQPEALLLIFLAAFVFLALGWICWMNIGRSKTVLPFRESPFGRK